MQTIARPNLITEPEKSENEYGWWAGNARFTEFSGRILGFRKIMQKYRQALILFHI